MSAAPDEPRAWLVRGNLRLNAACYERYFGGMESVVMLYEAEAQRLWVLPVRASRAGGFVLKQVNLRGDRSAAAHGFFRDHGIPDDCERELLPRWDAARQGLAFDLHGVAGSE